MEEGIGEMGGFGGMGERRHCPKSVSFWVDLTSSWNLYVNGEFTTGVRANRHLARNTAKVGQARKGPTGDRPLR